MLVRSLAKSRRISGYRATLASVRTFLRCKSRVPCTYHDLGGCGCDYSGVGNNCGGSGGSDE